MTRPGYTYLENDERREIEVETLDKLHRGTGIRLTTLMAACRVSRVAGEAVKL